MIFEQIRRGQRVEPHDTKRRRKDGSLVDVSLTVSPIRDEHDRIIGASKIARDITERKEAERLQRVLMGELKHRVKNVLATIQAIARQTFGNDNKAAREAFDARLLSMSRAHDLLTRDSWDGAELSAVVTEAIAPYHREHFEVSGPEVRLPPRVALALSLALHELGTNAGKYGALSVPTGRVTVSWRISPAPSPHLELRWQEQGGPTVVPPTRRGFGSRLIERVLAMELNGKVEIAYPPAGVVCDVSAPFDLGWDTAAEPDLQVSTV